MDQYIIVCLSPRKTALCRLFININKAAEYKVIKTAKTAIDNVALKRTCHELNRGRITERDVKLDKEF